MSRFFCRIGSCFVLACLFFSCQVEEEMTERSGLSETYVHDLFIARFKIDPGTFLKKYKLIHDFDSIIVIKSESFFENELKYETDTSDLIQHRTIEVRYSDYLICGVSDSIWDTKSMLSVMDSTKLFVTRNTGMTGEWSSSYGATAGFFVRNDVIFSDKKRLNVLYLYSAPNLVSERDSILASRLFEINNFKFLE